MKEITVDVIIPVYRPGERFGELLKRLDAQTQPVNRYIIMNTEQAYWDRWLSETGYSLPENLSVFHVTRETLTMEPPGTPGSGSRMPGSVSV